MQKQTIQKVLDDLPENVDVGRLIDRIILLEKIEAAEERLKAGKGVKHADAKRRMEIWRPTG